MHPRMRIWQIQKILNTNMFLSRVERSALVSRIGTAKQRLRMSEAQDYNHLISVELDLVQNQVSART